jgi:hypothetical protein
MSAIRCPHPETNENKQKLLRGVQGHLQCGIKENPWRRYVVCSVVRCPCTANAPPRSGVFSKRTPLAAGGKLKEFYYVGQLR